MRLAGLFIIGTIQRIEPTPKSSPSSPNSTFNRRKQGERFMNCNCIERVNKELANIGQELEQWPVINTTTFESSTDLALHTIPTRKGAKRGKLFMSFCPFCGKSNSDSTPPEK